jgi:hypothetical protein
MNEHLILHMGLEMPTQYLDACEHLVANVAGEGAHFPHFLGQVAGGRGRVVHRALHDGCRLHLTVEGHLLLCFCRKRIVVSIKIHVASVADSDPYDIILGLPDPDQKIRGTNPAPDPSMYHQAKKIRKTMIPTVLCSVADPHVFGPPGSGSGSISQEVWIRLRIRIWILLSPSKNNKKNLDSCCFVTYF